MPFVFIERATCMAKLKPDYLIESPFTLTAEMFLAENIKGIIMDVDNTIIPWKEKQILPFVKEWFTQLIDNGIEIVLLSNNTNTRIGPIAAQIKVPFVANAKKPSAYGIKKALDLLTMDEQSILLIGDQLLTDIFAGKKTAVKTMLVKPMASDMIPTRLLRLFEKNLLKRYKKKYNLDWRNDFE